MGELLTAAEVCDWAKISKTSLYDWLRTDPSFPKPVKVGRRAVRWKADELQAWLDNAERG